MRKKTWSWTVFIALMLCVGIPPFSPDLSAGLLPTLIPALLALAVLISAPLLRGCVVAAWHRVISPLPQPRTARRPFSPAPPSRPGEPGTRGVVRARAPDRFRTALG